MVLRAQRVLAAALAVLQLLNVARAADYTADLQAAQRSATAMQGSLQSFSATNIGPVDTSFVQTLGSQGMTPAANAAANNAYISTCRAAAANGYPGMTSQQKLDCQATITAAEITHTRDPYLDPANPTAARLVRDVKDRQAMATAQVTTGVVAAPSSITTTTTGCGTSTTPVPPILRNDSCHVERPVNSVWVDENVSITLDPSVASTKTMAYDTVICSMQNPPDSYPAGQIFCPAGGGGSDLVVSVDTSGLAPYAANPLAEAGDLVCVETTNIIVTTPPVPSSATPTQATYGVCTLYRQGYGIWNTAASWDESRCAQLAADTTCTATGYRGTKAINGTDVWADKTYSCVMTPASTSAIGTGCQTSLCIGGTCMDVSSTPNSQFGQTAVGLEVLREAGAYAQQDPSTMCPKTVSQYLAQCNATVGPCPDATGLLYLAAYPQCDTSSPSFVTSANLKIFSGISDSCKRPTGPGFGTNCCNSSSGTPLKANRQVLPSLAFMVAGNAVKAAGAYGVQQASPYVYDFMFSSGSEWLQEKAWGLMSSGALEPGSGFGMSLSLYGFSLTSGVAGTGGSITSLVGSNNIVADGLNLFGSKGNIWEAKDIMGSGMNLSFNPYVLAAMVAIQVITNLFSCSMNEKLLSTRRGGQLCEKTGEYCSRRVPIFRTCIQVTETWCCWNSRLAHLIAVQGGAQLGGGPRCGGFTPEELSRLDFSKIDLTSFVAEVMSNVTLPDGTYLSSMAQQGANRGADARNSVNPAAQSSTVSDPNLVNYASGRIQMMLNK